MVNTKLIGGQYIDMEKTLSEFLLTSSQCAPVNLARFCEARFELRPCKRLGFVDETQLSFLTFFITEHFPKSLLFKNTMLINALFLDMAGSYKS